MDVLRYFLALFLVVALPPLFFYWLLLHPFVKFWRGQSISVTYGSLLTITAVGMIALFSMRHHLLQIEYGRSYLLLVLGFLCLTVAAVMRLAIHKRLTVKVLLGLPEIAPDRFPRTLVTDGIYGRMRHPRYVQLLVALTGYALIANYLAGYFVAALWVPGIFVIALLEEKELRDHFGEAYENYCRNVPRFLPRPRRKQCDGDRQAQKPVAS